MNWNLRLREWLTEWHTANTGGKMTWMGFPIIKFPMDMYSYAQIIYECRPDSIIEIGSGPGGSAHFFSQMATLCDLSCHVVSIGNNPDDLPWSDRVALANPSITFIHGNCEDKDTLAAVKKFIRKKYRVMVIHDASHVATDVARDIEIYAPFVSPGQYLVVEDTILDVVREIEVGHPRPGPLKAVTDFLANHPEFSVVERWENMGMTHHPGGWLLRGDPIQEIVKELPSQAIPYAWLDKEPSFDEQA